METPIVTQHSHVVVALRLDGGVTEGRDERRMRVHHRDMWLLAGRVTLGCISSDDHYLDMSRLQGSHLFG